MKRCIDIFSTSLPPRSSTFEKRVRKMDAPITISATRAKNKRETRKHAKAWKYDTGIERSARWRKIAKKFPRPCVCAHTNIFYLTIVCSRHRQVLFNWYFSIIPFHKENRILLDWRIWNWKIEKRWKETLILLLPVKLF